MAMRSVWNGTVSFGLVNVPVKLMAAAEDGGLKHHSVHDKDHGRISYKKVCTDCGEVVDSKAIATMYEVDGQSAVLTDDELSVLDAGKDRTMEVLEFVPAGDIDPVMVDKSYYLQPDGKVKAYALLARVLKDAGRVAIVRLTLRSKTRLAALTVTGKQDVMVVHALRWPEEIREAHFPVLDNVPELSDAEVAMAGQIVASMHNAFNADRYQDTSKAELRELVAAKIDSVETPEAVEEVSDLLAALEASVAAKAPVAPVPTVARRPSMDAIRAWARANGHNVSDRGRIRADIVGQYEAAMA